MSLYSNSDTCPVSILDKYISKLPSKIKNDIILHQTSNESAIERGTMVSSYMETYTEHNGKKKCVNMQA